MILLLQPPILLLQLPILLLIYLLIWDPPSTTPDHDHNPPSYLIEDMQNLLDSVRVTIVVSAIF